MSMQKVNAIATNLSFEDHAAIEHVETILQDLLDNLGKMTTIVSTETGECIQMEEIPRVLGILSALREYRCWTVEI